jgi:hypothetical protein
MATFRAESSAAARFGLDMHSEHAHGSKTHMGKPCVVRRRSHRRDMAHALPAACNQK